MRVLVTYGWCRTAYVAVRSLSRQGHRVYACSSLGPAMCGWSRFCRGSARVADAFTQPESFTRDVARLVEKWGIEIVLPAHEDGLVLRRHESLLPPGIRLACPDLESFECAIDKARTTRLALAAGVPVPATRFPESVEAALADAQELGFPLVVKLRRSNSGKGVVAVSDRVGLAEVLHGRFHRFCAKPDRFPILQTMVEGEVVGACFVAAHGQIKALFQEKYLRCKDGRFGTSVFRERLVTPDLAVPVAKLVSAFKWTGIGHFDFILDRATGVPLMLEMNPRLWGAVNLAFVNGFDFPAALIAQTAGGTDLARYFAVQPVTDLRSLWLVGEMIAAFNRIRSGQWRETWCAAGFYLHNLRQLRFDDLVWHDPLPLLAEVLGYAGMFLRSGGSTNPVVEGMLE